MLTFEGLNIFYYVELQWISVESVENFIFAEIKPSNESYCIIL